MSRGLTVCFPYGAGVECSCGTRGRILRCRPLPLDEVAGHQPPPGDGPGQVYEELGQMLSPALGEEDERTEILLAATFLLIVILAFIGFIVHRCERGLEHRRQSQCRGGRLKVSQSSVSIQTVPAVIANGGSNLNTISRTANGSTWLGSDRDESLYGGIQRHAHLFQPTLSMDALHQDLQESHLHQDQ